MNKDRFETYVYATGLLSDSPLRDRIRRGCTVFRELPNVSDEYLQQLLRQDQLDVLIDLAGYTEGGRIRVTASKPARTTVNWLGYPGTLGSGVADYLLADPVVIPKSHEHYYSEEILRLPHCLLPADRSREISEAMERFQYGLPESAVVLACFAQPQKWTLATITTWFRVMKIKPETVLWIADPHATALSNVRELATKFSVSPSRIIPAAKLQSQSDHLARYLVADIALDTHPYGSHATALDALWVGCPMIALKGNTFAARVSASVLTTAGMPEWIAETHDEYAQKLISLIDRPDVRGRIRADLVSRRNRSVLFDVSEFTSRFQAILESITAQREPAVATINTVISPKDSL